MTTTIETVTHQVNRLAIPIDASFDAFRAQYEAAVPELDTERVAALVAESAPRERVLEAAAENAPHRFMRFWTFDVAPLMGLAGHPGRCVEYLMGNHTIAERMYRHEPGVMLYAPLRTMIHESVHGEVRCFIDQPSTRFASFGLPAITAVGLELDQLLAALLETLGAPVPSALAWTTTAVSGLPLSRETRRAVLRRSPRARTR